ncbi:MAG: xanthine dehydrogenase family protein subunit M [Beijerinckiaceae bacterium]
MKAAPFEYVRPQSLAEACAILAADEDARPVSGGQTLTPMMAMRLARPSKLVDIARLPELSGIRREGDSLVLGAAVRQAVAEHSAEVEALVPLLAAALPWVGHQPTRNRGTVGGSVANADPAAEIPLVLMALEGSVRFQSVTGAGEMSAADFFEGPMMTALDAGAIVTALAFPIWDAVKTGTGFHEVSARKSDFAYVSAAAQACADANGKVTRCTIAIGAATPAPARLAGASAAVVSGASPDSVAAAIADDVAALEIMTDGHASEAYRRRVAVALAKRALADALKGANA